jgi:hypothetical protein
MKIKKWEKLFAAVLVVFFIAQPQIFAQQAQQPVKKESSTEVKADPRNEYIPGERPEENYLSRFKAIETAEKLTKQNLEDIYLIKIIIANFSDQGWQKDYETIYAQYKKGVAMYYTRDVVYSSTELQKNKQAIAVLFTKMAEFYKKQTVEMLEKCADKILDFSLDEKTQFDPNKNKVLFNNMMRLWVAYGQIDDAEKSRIDKLNKIAIFHLRISKTYAISILEELDAENSKGKYDVHKADNMNRFANIK